MPIPAAPAGRSDIASTVLALFEQLHHQIREELTGLDDHGLNWSPGEGANTIAIIVTHLLGSEAETLRCVAGVACVRDREAEFVSKARPMGDILGELESADRRLRALQPEIDAHRLRRVLGLATLPDHEQRSGLTWLVGNYGHAREHVGHIQLTKQLYRAASSAP